MAAESLQEEQAPPDPLAPAESESDESVVARVVAGETDQFQVLMRRFNRRVYRTVRAVLRDDREAEDAAQEAWAKAFVHLRSFEGRSRFSTWLTRIALNEAFHRIRDRRRAVEAASDSRVLADGTDGSAEQSALRDEVRRALESAIDALPDPYRTTFMLRMVEGLSTGETAECLEIPEKTVKTRLHRARSHLRRDLEARFGSGLRESFPFAGDRCDRMVALLLTRIRIQGGPPGPPACP